MTPDWLAGFEAGARAMSDAFLEALRAFECENEGALLKVEERLLRKAEESIASTHEAHGYDGAGLCKCGEIWTERHLLNYALGSGLGAAHTQTEEKPSPMWYCNKCGYIGSEGPLHSGCNYHAAWVPNRPKRQEPPKHEECIFTGFTCGIHGHAKRHCYETGDSWPCPQAPAPAEKENG